MKKQYLVVRASAANLRRESVEVFSEHNRDDLLETQLLYNECLLYKDEVEDWYFVEAIEQKKATAHDTWQGYPGWVKKDCVIPVGNMPLCNAVIKAIQSEIKKSPLAQSESLGELFMGTRLTIEDKGNDDYYKTALNDGQTGWIRKDDVNILRQTVDITHLRKNIIETAKMLLGMPYLWGGRSVFMSQDPRRSKTQVPRKIDGNTIKKIKMPTSDLSPLSFRLLSRPADEIMRGVDCSGLTNLAYRVNRIDIPRDAHDQWLISSPVLHGTLLPADLIFISAQDDYNRITHVMICLNDKEFVEAFETGSVVTINTFKNKFGLSLQEAASQDFIVNRRKICFGSVF